MKITVLGCGSSNGIPRIGCECLVCTSANHKNIRTRSSILIEKDGVTILIDAGPDFRQQALRHNIRNIDAVIYTHAHADHIFGTGDLRILSFIKNDTIDIYATKKTFKALKTSFAYAFIESDRIFKPFLKANIVKEYAEIDIKGLKVSLFAQTHHKIVSLGVRVGNFVYSTDVKSFPKRSLSYLENLDVWILGCLRYYGSPGHLTYEEALELIEKYQPKQAYFTHMCHEMEYDDLNHITPPSISPAYDGLIIFNT